MRFLSTKHILIILISLTITIFVFSESIEYEKSVFRDFYYPSTGNSIAYKAINESGIPIVDYGYSHGIFIGKQMNPVAISQQALYYESEYQKGNESCKQLFLNNANYLVENSIQYENYTLWQYNYPWPAYNLTSPWVSAMAQGQGLQVLIRAYNMTDDKKYLDATHLTLNSFYVEVKDGGVTYKDENGWWYEEYVTGTDVQPRVLNGMIFSLFGIYEYYEFTGDKDAKYLFDQGITSLKNNLYRYDAGDWTYYDAIGHSKVGVGYSKIHVNQMLQLYKLTKDPFFKEYYEKFNKYDQNPVYKIKSKTLDYFLYAINFMFMFITFETIFSNRFKNFLNRVYSRNYN